MINTSVPAYTPQAPKSLKHPPQFGQINPYEMTEEVEVVAEKKAKSAITGPRILAGLGAIGGAFFLHKKFNAKALPLPSETKFPLWGKITAGVVAVEAQIGLVLGALGFRKAGQANETALHVGANYSVNARTKGAQWHDMPQKIIDRIAKVENPQT